MGLENVIHCKICHRMFQYSGYGEKYCPSCKEQDEADFQKVKTYLRDHPGMSIVHTAEDCEVPVERIRAWLREERLEFSGEGNTGLICDYCGKPITTGTMCEECRQTRSKIAGEMSRSIERPTLEKPMKSKTGDRMRFLGSR